MITPMTAGPARHFPALAERRTIIPLLFVLLFPVHVSAAPEIRPLPANLLEAPSRNDRLPPAPPAGGTARQETPETLHAAGITTLRNGDHAAAETLFRTLVQAYPQHPLAGQAWYWLGRSLFVRQQYDEAAVALFSGWDGFPEAPTGYRSFFYLGLSLVRTEKPEDRIEGCAVLASLADSHPRASAYFLRRAREAQAALCPGRKGGKVRRQGVRGPGAAGVAAAPVTALLPPAAPPAGSSS